MDVSYTLLIARNELQHLSIDKKISGDNRKDRMRDIIVMLDQVINDLNEEEGTK